MSFPFFRDERSVSTSQIIHVGHTFNAVGVVSHTTDPSIATEKHPVIGFENRKVYMTGINTGQSGIELSVST